MCGVAAIVVRKKMMVQIMKKISKLRLINAFDSALFYAEGDLFCFFFKC